MFIEWVNKLKPWRHQYCGRQCDAKYLAPTFQNSTKSHEHEYTRNDNPCEVFSSSPLLGVLRSVTGVALGN